MTNPSPRPALRKSDDAGVHPAAPVPARSPRAPRRASVPPVAAPADEPAHEAGASGTRAVDFHGTTSDHLRRSDAPTAAHDEVHDRGTKARKKSAALMAGDVASVKVRLPKKLRKAAEKEAKRRGLDLDAVVADLLHAWVTGSR